MILVVGAYECQLISILEDNQGLKDFRPNLKPQKSLTHFRKLIKQVRNSLSILTGSFHVD